MNERGLWFSGAAAPWLSEWDRQVFQACQPSYHMKPGGDGRLQLRAVLSVPVPGHSSPLLASTIAERSNLALAASAADALTVPDTVSGQLPNSAAEPATVTAADLPGHGPDTASGHGPDTGPGQPAIATEIEQLAAQVRGDDPAAEPVEETPAEPTAAADPGPELVVEGPAQPATATASLVARLGLNLSNVRRNQPRELPEPPAPTTSITAAVDVPGYTPGSPLGFIEITAGIISRANALKTAGGGVGQVISYRHPYPEDLIVTDSSSAPEGTNVALRASDQNRLPQATSLPPAAGAPPPRRSTSSRPCPGRTCCGTPPRSSSPVVACATTRRRPWTSRR